MAKLAAYLAKRDFSRTSEPRDEGDVGSGSSFVIQKHDASRLHYDLRLELDGVMKSWAVTRGPSLSPDDKRLAVHVEDHPIGYNTFEGTIPKGQYGGGTVMIWDRGSWTPKGDPHFGLNKGHLEFSLAGEKLHGAFHLVRLKPRGREKQESWLLIKSDDDFARPDGPDILEEMPLSVTTGRTLDEIATARDGAVWESNREPKGDAQTSKTKRAHPPSPQGRTEKAPSAARGGETPAGKSPPGIEAAPRPALPSGEGAGRATPAKARAKKAVKADDMPTAIEPCLANLAPRVPNGPLWVHEIKWDGYRLLAFRSARSIKIATRRGHDWTTRFPGIRDAVQALPVESAILDGEAVILDDRGVPSFSAMQNALSDEHGRIARDAVFFAFDLLYLDGQDLRGLSLLDRKARLAALIPPRADGTLRLSEHVEADGPAMLKSACEMGLEGVISKRRDRPYRSGRGDDWIKIKCLDRQEFVVAGFVPSAVAQRAIGSLVLGYNETGEFKHAGRAGTGYTGETARALFRQLSGESRKASPFKARLTAEERRDVVWVDPTRVAEIEFRGWTADGRLRHAAFKGLRDDKTADEVVREQPAGRPGPEREPAPGPRAAGGRTSKGVSVAGVPLTHPERELWAGGITKQELAEFYEAIADRLLPEIVGRPLSLVRCPSGAGAGCFFQKHAWAGTGEAVRRATARDADGDEEVLYVESMAGVVSLVQASCLEIHSWGATMADVEHPDRIVMDLDPAEDVAWTDVIAAARDVRDRLRGVGLESFVKTTGGKGLHVVVPLKPKADWAEVKGFAKALSDAMEADDPKRYLAKASKQARKGRIYVDYLRNGRGATAIAPYSTRARPGAPIAVPVAWEELTSKLKPNGFTLRNLADRLAKVGDPWAEIGRFDQVLPRLDGAKAKRTR